MNLTTISTQIHSNNHKFRSRITQINRFNHKSFKNDNIQQQSRPPVTTTPSLITDINSPNHPLYLHPNDHHGLILILKKLTGSENYSSWKRSMMIALNAKNKLKIVNGEYVEKNVDSELREIW